MLRHVRRLRLCTFSASAPSSRSYATRRPPPHEALVARTASTPLAVRERREKKLGRPTPQGQTDASPDGLSPSDMARYERHKALGTLPKVTITTKTTNNETGEVQTKEEETDISPLHWFKRRNARRSRIRGLRIVNRPVSGATNADAAGKTTQKEVQILGQPIYLPNIIFRLVRNHTRLGETYNPYEATFRVPPSLTKTDIRSYLFSVYAVKTTYIRTDLYYGRLVKRGQSHRKERRVYKRAVVGLVDPFYYPHRAEDMSEKEREEREKFLEDNYFLQASKESLREQKLRSAVVSARGGDEDRKWKFSGAVRGRGKILAEVARRRQLKEGMVAGLVSEWQQMRAAGEKVSVPMPRNRKPTEKKELEEAK